MEINEHYDEVLDLLDRLFVYMFTGLQASCGAPFPCHKLQIISAGLLHDYGLCC